VNGEFCCINLHKAHGSLVKGTHGASGSPAVLPEPVTEGLRSSFSASFGWTNTIIVFPLVSRKRG